MAYKNPNFKAVVADNFYVEYQISDTDKQILLDQYSKTFHESCKLMPWLEDSNVPAQDKIEYFVHMYNIFDTLHKTLDVMLRARILEIEILETLSLPF